MDRHDIDATRFRALEAFSAIPGVLWVGFGIKETGGALTDTLALRVYVEAKRPPDAIPEDEQIPNEFEGLPTDVVRISRSTAEGAENRSHRAPMFSGLTITNRKVDPDHPERGYPVGSIGFFATMEGMAGKENIFLISNHHVLGANGGGNGDTIYHPHWNSMGIDGENHGPIGEVDDAGAQEHHAFRHAGDAAELQYYVDCGTAKIKIKISSWCNCSTGASYRNRLFDFDGTANEKITGVARAVETAAVFKSGRTTGRTSGTVVDVNGATLIDSVGIMATNIITVSPTDPPDAFFSDTGDSGAALVDTQNRLVGLHFGSNRDQVQADIDAGVPEPAMLVSHACHIGAVLDYLSDRASAVLTPISEDNPPIGPAGKTRSSEFTVLDGMEDHTVRLQTRALRTQVGQRLLVGFEAHRDEILDLVNHCRPVLVTWHRGKGPMFVAHLAESARAPGHAIPHAIDGQGRGDLLSRMADVLIQHGSPALGAYLTEQRDEALRLVRQIDDLHDFVATLERETVDG